MQFNQLGTASLQYAEYIKSYFDGESIDIIPLGFKEMALMGNLHAFHFWERVYKVSFFV